jgi:hypothetical protein
MSQLVKHTDLSPQLSPEEKSIVIASRGKKIMELTKLELANIVTDCVDIALIELGHKNLFNDQADKDILIKSITQDIADHFKGLTAEEIKQVFRLGVRGEFKSKKDEVITLTAVSVFRWIKSYKEFQRKEAFKKQLEFQINEEKKSKVEVTEEFIKKQQETTKQIIAEDFAKYVNLNITPYDFGNVQYDYLKKIGLINLSDDQQKNIWEQAKEQLKNSYHSGSTPKEINNNKRLYSELLNDSNNLKSKLVIVSKQIALKEFFEEVKKSGKNIQDLLNK